MNIGTLSFAHMQPPLRTEPNDPDLRAQRLPEQECPPESRHVVVHVGGGECALRVRTASVMLSP